MIRFILVILTAFLYLILSIPVLLVLYLIRKKKPVAQALAVKLLQCRLPKGQLLRKQRKRPVVKKLLSRHRLLISIFSVRKPRKHLLLRKTQHRLPVLN